mmetsp:Transcript_34774/g.80109  ORF Transcript_34774/g.80109 Transcript_34774/m.80109 type:complete len:212 (-) Transcript_34774:180-815(-)
MEAGLSWRVVEVCLRLVSHCGRLRLRPGVGDVAGGVITGGCRAGAGEGVCCLVFCQPGNFQCLHHLDHASPGPRADRPGSRPGLLVLRAHQQYGLSQRNRELECPAGTVEVCCSTVGFQFSGAFHSGGLRLRVLLGFRSRMGFSDGHHRAALADGRPLISSASLPLYPWYASLRLRCRPHGKVPRSPRLRQPDPFQQRRRPEQTIPRSIHH